MSRDKTHREEQVRANAEAIIAELRAGHDCAFATLGDAHDLQYVRLCTGNHPQSHSQSGSGSHPRHHLIRHAHRQGGTVLVENGEQLRIIPSFRAEMAEALDFPKGSTTILLKSYRSRGALLDRLAREEKVQVLYGEHLAMKEQALLTDPDAIRARPGKVSLPDHGQETMKARSSIPPWKRPGWVLWFVLAAVCSCWFILHMPWTRRG